MKSPSPVSPATAGWLALWGVLLGVLYRPTVLQLVGRWSKEDYNYCYLMPAVVLYLLWEKRAALAALRSTPAWAGLIPLGAGLSLFWLGELGGEFFVLYLSLWLVVVGLAWLHLGGRKLRVVSFALAMIPTMFPLPSFLNTKVTLSLQLLSTRLGVALLEVVGMSAHREGNVVDLGFTQLQVVEACSGLRYVFPLLVLGLILGYVMRTRWWGSVALAVSGVGAAIVGNSGRIALTGILYEQWGPGVAEGFLHDFTGWFVFMLALAILVPEALLLRRFWPAAPGDKPGTAPTPASPVREEAGRATWLPPKQAAVALALLALTLAASQGIDFREKVPLQRPLSQLPLHLETWVGTAQTMNPIFIDTLHFSDYALVDYRGPKGAPVNFYIAYYQSQRKGESIHSPDTCLPGSGWIFEDSGVVEVPTPGFRRGSLPVKRALMTKVGEKSLSYYWFPQRGRILTSPYQLKLYAFWDALVHRRTDGALVRLVTAVPEGETVEAADARLRGFLRLMAPLLDRYLPGAA